MINKTLTHKTRHETTRNLADKTKDLIDNARKSATEYLTLAQHGLLDQPEVDEYARVYAIVALHGLKRRVETLLTKAADDTQEQIDFSRY